MSDGVVSYWVQADDWSRAGAIVRQAMREEGMGEDEIREFFRANMTIRHQTWRQLLNTTLCDSGIKRPMLSAFVGGRDAVIACTEWDSR